MPLRTSLPRSPIAKEEAAMAVSSSQAYCENQWLSFTCQYLSMARVCDYHESVLWQCHQTHLVTPVTVTVIPTD